MARDNVVPVPAGWIAGAIIALGVGAGALYGLPLGVLGLAGGVLVGIVLLVWASVQSLTGSTPLSLEEAISLGAPSAEEERKQAVLRALKDLEYERSVGKIAEADYHELSARYRGEAKALLKALDHDIEPFRKRVLDEVERRVGPAAAAESPQDTRTEPAVVAEAAAAALPGEPPVEQAPAPAVAPHATGRVACPECGAGNESDARFCKRCAARLPEVVS